VKSRWVLPHLFFTASIFLSQVKSHTAAFALDVYAHVTAQMKMESTRRMQSFISLIVQRYEALRKIIQRKAKNKDKRAEKPCSLWYYTVLYVLVMYKRYVWGHFTFFVFPSNIVFQNDTCADQWEDEDNLSHTFTRPENRNIPPCHLGARKPLQPATFRVPKCVGWISLLQLRLVHNLYGTCTVAGQVSDTHFRDSKSTAAVHSL